MTYVGVRNELGRIILLGLEILIIADIIQTITVDLTLKNAATLGVIVLVRTFLSFSLEIELEGAPPWRRLELARAVGAVFPDRPEATAARRGWHLRRPRRRHPGSSAATSSVRAAATSQRRRATCGSRVDCGASISLPA